MFSMFRKSFKRKIILPTIMVLVVLAVTLISYTVSEFFHYSDSLINDKVTVSANSLKLHVNNLKEHSKVAAVSMAYNPKAIEAIKNRNREDILKVFADECDFYKVNFYTITDNEGIVLARTHEPDHFGDLISNQQNIKNALNGKTTSYLEAGKIVKVSTRTGAPVYDADSNLVGVVSAGVRFDIESTVDELKELLHADVSVFYGDERMVTTIIRNGKRAAGTKLSPEIAKAVIEGKNIYFGDTDILNERYKAFYMPLMDANDEVFAILFVGKSKTELETEVNKLIRNVIIISLSALLLAVFILYFIISSISKPLIMLSQGIDNIEAGNLNISVKTRGKDEVSRAGNSLCKMVDTLHKLINEINVTISEHRKGNMYYNFDVNVFHGDYRLLADRIIELSNISIRDQLTGLPNRYTLDNRLALEWARAERDKTPLSLLMIDVDRFKNYNDAFGHQQGDVALQTIAKTLMRTLKREVDFTARWGGEEFVVLLPNTDSSGAMHVAEQIRAKIENAEIPSVDENAAKITVSIGVNTQFLRPKSSIKDLIAKVDKALYRAKHTGRNKVCSHEGGTK